MRVNYIGNSIADVVHYFFRGMDVLTIKDLSDAVSEFIKNRDCIAEVPVCSL